jgi:CheY-like chemotaxis protein
LSQNSLASLVVLREGLKIVFELAFYPYDSQKIDDSSVRLSIDNSLKVKIAKCILEKLANKELTVVSPTNQLVILTFSLNFDEESLRNEEIPDEGERLYPTYPIIFEKRRECNLIDIMIVDDYQINLEILSRLIQNLKDNCKCLNPHKNYAIHVAKSGKQAIGLILKQEKANSGYKMIFMDCQMPEMDGWETTKAIHELFDSQEITILPYIIAYSAFDSSEDIENSYKSGMNGHISKPCYQDELCRTLNKWLCMPLNRHVSQLY